MVVFSQTSCVVFDQMGLRGQNVEHYTPPPKLPSFDSLTVTAIINDTVFSAIGCTQYLKGRRAYVDFRDSDVPVLRIVLFNRSSSGFLVANERLSTNCGELSDFVGWVRAELGICSSDGGRARLSVRGPRFITAFENRSFDRDMFVYLGEGDSVAIERPVANPLCELGSDHLDTGVYWTRLFYSVNLKTVKDTVTYVNSPQWYGLIWSDTVFFRVTE
jgi:hypothetical protein